MRRWYEGAEESAFKPVAGGYVAQLSRSQRYLVNDAQKAEIAAALRRKRRLMLYLAPIGPLIGIAFVELGKGYGGLGLMVGGILLLLYLFALGLVDTYVMRPLRPLLATLPRTEERITFRESVENIAGASGKALVMGIVALVLAIILLITALAIAIQNSNPLGILILILFLGLVTAYFAWLIILRSH